MGCPSTPSALARVAVPVRAWPSRANRTVTGLPGLACSSARARARPSSVEVAMPLTASRRSPWARPMAAAGLPGFTTSTALVACRDGTPIHATAAKQRNATTRFTKGPAKIVATFFHVFAE